MNEYMTPDLSLAAFLLMRGVKLKKAEKSKSGKFIFLFSDVDNSCQNLALEFLNSEFSNYDNHIRNLKKIIYSS
jgi:hypothetical protein